MTVLLLDERWPTLIPMEAHGALLGPVSFTGEVPVRVRWNFSDLLKGEDPLGVGLLVSTDPHEPEVVARLEAGERLIEAESRKDPMFQARTAMAQAVRIGEWERAQTHESLLPYLAEESAEFAESVRSQAGDEHMRGEFGDVLLQVLFHAELASRRGAFTLDDVADSFVAKLRSRAPYLFDGTNELVAIERQEQLWAEGKAREKSQALD